MHPNAAVIYDKYRDFSSAGMKGSPTRDQMYDKITLMPDYQWLKPKKVHPMILKLLEAHLRSTFPKFRFEHGRSDEGDFFALKMMDHYEFFRLTVRATNPNFKTDEQGLWFLAREGYDVLPPVAKGPQSSMLYTVYDVLKVLEVEGRDGDNDVSHMGTYVEKNISGFSHVHVVFRFGNRFWILSHQARKIPFAVGVREMACRLETAYTGEEDEPLHQITRWDSHTQKTAIGLYDSNDAGGYGEMIDEDLIAECMELTEQIPALDYVYSQAQSVREQLAGTASNSHDPRVHRICDYLANYSSENLLPYQLIDQPDRPYVDVRYFCGENRSIFAVRIFRTPK